MIVNINQLDLNKVYSYADYLTWTFDERVELIKGKILQMSPAPSRRHQGISSQLQGVFWNHCKNQMCNLYAAPFDVRLPVSPDIKISNKLKKKAKQLADGKILTVVQPDLTVICDKDKLDDRGCIGAPDLVVEILSPGNHHPELNDKFESYQEAGVEEYWIVDPQDEFVIVYNLVKGKYSGSKPYSGDAALMSKILKDLNVNVSEIFDVN